jgi:RibD C-terminal domain
MFVLTHDASETAAAGFTFVSGDIEEAVAAAKAAAGDKYVVVFGASTAQECLDAGVLNEVLVHIARVLLGDGVRLFDRPGGTNVKLERIGLTHSPPGDEPVATCREMNDLPCQVEKLLGPVALGQAVARLQPARPWPATAAPAPGSPG